jgi:hypothetical protein
MNEDLEAILNADDELRAACLTKWAPLLLNTDHDDLRRHNTAIILDTIQRDLDNPNHKPCDLDKILVPLTVCVLNRCEFWNLVDVYPMMSPVARVTTDSIVSIVEAKTRRLGVRISSELSLDATENDIINILAYEVSAEIDKEIIGNLAKQAITAKQCLRMDDPMCESNTKQSIMDNINTMVEKDGEYLICDSIMSALASHHDDFVECTESANICIRRKGSINGKDIYEDTFATNSYIINGSKSDLVYNPYVLLQLCKIATVIKDGDAEDFSPTEVDITNISICARTRFGITYPEDHTSFIMTFGGSDEQ